LTFCFRNYGKTAALIRALGYGAEISEAPPNPPKYYLAAPLPFDHIVAADEATKTAEFTLLPRLTPAIGKSILAELKNTFWFYGFITYDDAFGWTEQ
jgi:hypothetical protein